MASNELDVLRDRLYTQADARLRNRLTERLEGFRNLTRTVARIEFEANDVSTDAPVQVYLSAADLVTIIGQGWFREVRDQNRAEFVDKFLAKVREKGL